MVKRKPRIRAKPPDLYLARTQAFWTRFEPYCGEKPVAKEQAAWLLLLVVAVPEIPESAYGRIEEHLLELLGKGKA